jgi:CheY-like chemotaxis protein
MIHSASICAERPGPPIILIVEDDPLLRMIAVEYVEDAGYLAVEAENADEALEILECHSDIALLLTDINMPGSMDGAGLTLAVRARWPAINIIVVSGQMQLFDLALPPGCSFFGKPYQPSALLAAMHSMTGGPKAKTPMSEAPFSDR